MTNRTNSFFNRPPHIQKYELPAYEIKIPNPPSPANFGGRAGLLGVGLPIVAILGYAVVGTISGRTASLLFVIPMGISVVVTSIVSFIMLRQNQRQEREKRENYDKRLQDLRRQMTTVHEQQRQFYQDNFPDPTVLLQYAARTDSRLWERRPDDEFFAVLRMGTGRLRSKVVFSPPGSETAETAQIADARKLADDALYVSGVPNFLHLRKTHTLGIVGRNQPAVYDFARAMLVHYTALHAPSDARLYIVGTGRSRQQWEWASWLPHCNTARINQARTSEQLSFDSKRIPQMWRDLQRELERRQARLGDKGSSGDPTLPFLLIVVDLLSASQEPSPLTEVESEAAVSLLLTHGQELGAAIVFLVPDRSLVPSDCRAVVDLDLNTQEKNVAPMFRYGEIGINSERHDGLADATRSQEADEFARKLAPLVVRTSSSVELPLGLSLLDLYRSDSVESLVSLDSWRRSRDPKDLAYWYRSADPKDPMNSDWPRVPIGIMGNGEVRELVFDQELDGIHGMIAGTTGSGKSELLVTIIVGLALRYDPTIVNFVLVDYKGGNAFDQFRQLPHTVDVVTNLKGQDVVRTFIALRAEIDRRSALLTKRNVKKIVEYRQKGYHLDEPFPHLFVIIDEFAEMLKDKGDEVRARLDSVARLGRAVGVHLILATQRPTGVVSDQIRANMKFRICLRVETADDSRELLRRTDAAFLPSNIPGRAYLQVGNDNVALIQVAWAGAPYLGPQIDVSPLITWLDRPRKDLTLVTEPGQQTNTVGDALILRAHQLVQQNEDVVVLRKPWPDALPGEGLYLNTQHLPDNPEIPLRERVTWPDILNPADALDDWRQGQNAWHQIDWQAHAMRAAVGLLDNPTESKWRPLVLDFTRAHVAVIGASGYGKTSLIRTTITSLVVTHSPRELNIYVLDFGGRGLEVFERLPHVAAIITPSENERVQRLLRRLNNDLEERKSRLSEARANDLYQYNAGCTDPAGGDILPAILLVIDNFAEFAETFSGELDNLVSLAREGRAYGIHLLITAERLNAVSSKLLSQFIERLAMKLTDHTEYSAIVGRSVGDVADFPGRGYVRRDRTPLEFQVAMPLGADFGEADANLNDSQRLAKLVQDMATAWDVQPRPEPIEVLRTVIPLSEVLDQAPTIIKTGHIQSLIGVRDLDLMPEAFDLGTKSHFIFAGPPVSGKTTALRCWALALADCYSPDQVRLILVDFQQGRFSRYGGNCELVQIPHVHKNQVVTELEQMADIAEELSTEFGNRATNQLVGPEIFVLIDNYDDFASAVAASQSVTANPNRPGGAVVMPRVPDLRVKLGMLARKYGSRGLHFVASASPRSSKGTNDEFMSKIAEQRYGLGLVAKEATEALNVTVRGSGPGELSPGRGYLVKGGRPYLFQIATPQEPGSDMEHSLDAWIDRIQSRWEAPKQE